MTKVVLPPPEFPTKAIVWPFFKCKLMSFKTGMPGLYSNPTCLKVISFFNPCKVFGSLPSLIATGCSKISKTRSIAIKDNWTELKFFPIFLIGVYSINIAVINATKSPPVICWCIINELPAQITSAMPTEIIICIIGDNQAVFCVCLMANLNSFVKTLWNNCSWCFFKL